MRDGPEVVGYVNKAWGVTVEPWPGDSVRVALQSDPTKFRIVPVSHETCTRAIMFDHALKLHENERELIREAVRELVIESKPPK